MCCGCVWGLTRPWIEGTGAGARPWHKGVEEAHGRARDDAGVLVLGGDLCGGERARLWRCT